MFILCAHARTGFLHVWRQWTNLAHPDVLCGKSLAEKNIFESLHILHNVQTVYTASNGEWKYPICQGCATKIVPMLQVIVVIPRSRRSPAIPDSIAAR